MFSQSLLQISRYFKIRLLKYDLKKRYAHNDRNVNVQMHIDT